MNPPNASQSTILELLGLVENGDINRAVQILNAESETDTATFLEPWGSLQVTLVQLAAWRGSIEVLEHLDTRGADLDATDKLGRCALHHAAHQGHVEVVSWLLERGATVEARFGVRFLPKDKPYSATSGPKLTSFEIGKNLPLPECWGRTALHQAVKAGHVEVVRLLVDAGANVDAKDDRGVTPIHLAAVNIHANNPIEMDRYEKIIDILVSAFASINLVHPDTGTTALHHAVTLGNKKAIMRLLRGGASPSAHCTCTGITPLHIAAGTGVVEVLELLLLYLDASLINVRDQVGRTPLHAAAYRGHLECVKSILDHGGNLASETTTGMRVIDAIFENIPRPIAFLTEVLNSRVRATDKTGNHVSLDFRILAPQGELQMAVVSALIAAVPNMEQMTILQHPLLEAFLGLKWARLRGFFFLLVAVHILFVLSLSAYAVLLLNRDLHLDSALPRIILFLCACILLAHNLLQLVILPKYYARQFETWLSLICVTISLTVAIAGEFIDDRFEAVTTNDSEQSKDSPPQYQYDPPQWILQSISVAILFSWIQMMLLVGRFPTWGYYALMFSTVLKNVIKVLLAFVWLIVGFAFSFSVLFHRNDQFKNSWKSVVKTIVMMMGEYEYGQLFASDLDNENTFVPVLGRIVFLMFVMLASIVLMNLMIGVAVSDIQGLLNEGHVRRLLKQAEFVAHLEWLTSHRTFQSRFVPKFLREVLKSKNMVLTQMSIGMFTGFEIGAGNIPDELVEVLFELAAKTRDLEKNKRLDRDNVDATCEWKKAAPARATTSAPEEADTLEDGQAWNQKMHSARRMRRRISSPLDSSF
ncbi:transient receptor potential channel pyrexia-like [Athalia rosae]|uniref:transient receptor potential channel pyrexia-like n=1 Tax=Athalia rosae TaxID=37344 RepID=UPI002033CEDE|nr:transient receptor potential channel pyrexia-like [Athalia rosae]